MKLILRIFIFLLLSISNVYGLALTDTDPRGPGYLEDDKTTFSGSTVHNSIFGNSNIVICIVDTLTVSESGCPADSGCNPTWDTGYAVTGLDGAFTGGLWQCIEGLNNEAGETIGAKTVSAGSSKIILFEVSGDITASTPTHVDIIHNKTALIGQSAPKPGVQFENFGLRIRADDVLVQHIRSRYSDNSGGTSCDARDNFIISDGASESISNVILDHVSGQFGTDEIMDTWTESPSMNTNLDITYSIFGDAINDNDSCHSGSTYHSKGFQINEETDNVNYTGCLAYRAKDRMPLYYGEGGFLANNGVMGVTGEESAGHLQARYYTGQTQKKLTVVGNLWKKGSWNKDYGIFIGDTTIGWDSWDTSYMDFHFDDNITKGCSSTYASSCADDYDDTNLVNDIDNVLDDTPDPKVTWSAALKPTGFVFDAATEVEDNIAGNNEKWKVPGAWPSTHCATSGSCDTIDNTARSNFASDTGGTAPDDEAWINLNNNSFTHSLPINPFTVTANGYTNLEEWYHEGGTNSTYDWGTSKAEDRNISFTGGTPIYVSAAGDDSDCDASYASMTWSTACNSIADLNSIPVADGDYDIWFRAGDTFNDTELDLASWTNITSSSTIRIATSDGGDSRDLLAEIGGWTNTTGNIWETSLNNTVQILWLDGRLAFNIAHADPENSTCYSGLDEDYEWCHDGTAKKIYLYSTGGDPDTAYTSITAPHALYGFAVLSGATNKPIDLDNSTYGWDIQNIEISYIKVIDHDFTKDSGGEMMLLKQIGNVNFHHNYVDPHEDGQNGTRGAYGIRILINGQSGTQYVEVKNNIMKNSGPKPMANSPGTEDVYNLEIDNDQSAYYLIQYNQLSHAGADNIQIRKVYSSSNTSIISHNRIFDCFRENWIDMKMTQYYRMEYNWFWNEDNTDSDDDGIHLIVTYTELSGGDNAHGVVRYNKFQGLNKDELIVLGNCNSSYPQVIEDIQIYGNWFKDSAAGIIFDGESCINDIDVYNNIFENIYCSLTDKKVAAIQIGIPAQEGANDGDIRIFNNTIYGTADCDGIWRSQFDDSSNNPIENNIIYINNANAYCLYDEDASSDQDPKYNHLWNPSGTEAFWDNTSYTSTAAWQAAGHTDGEIEDPQLNNVSSDEFWPSGASSNVVNRGGGSNLSAQGFTNSATWYPSFNMDLDLESTKDRGAFEFITEGAQNTGVITFGTGTGKFTYNSSGTGKLTR